MPISLVQALAFTASDLWSPSSEKALPVIASRVHRLAAGKLSYVVPALQRTMLQDVARKPSSHPSVEAARQAAYQAILRSNFPMAIEEQENDVEDIEGDPELDQVFNESSPLALDVIAGLQPSHVDAAFGWTANLPVGRRAIAATIATAHALTRHGPDSTQELFARIEYLQNDNKMFSIERVVHTCTQFPNAPQSDFYLEAQMGSYSDYMVTCRDLQISLKSHNLPTAAR